MNYPIKNFGEFDSRAEEMTLTWFEHSDESVFVIAVDSDHFIIEALNPAHERRTGLRNAEIAGKAPHEFLPAATADAITANYRRCLDEGETIRYDEVLDLGSGSRHWQTVLTPVRDPSGCIRRILGSARDVTEERQIRWQAEQARGLLQDMIEASPDILHIFNLETGGSTLVGGRAGEILGWSQDDLAVLRSDFVAALIHPDDVAAVAGHLRALRLLAHQDMATVEFRMRRADGGYVWLRSRQRPYARGNDGLVSKVFGSACSIQEYKEAEAELRATNERLTSTLSSIAECYFTLGRDYRISDVNRACLEWLGCGRADVVGQSYWDFCRPEDVCGATTRRAMEERRPVQRELRSAVRPDRWLDFRVFPSEEGATVFFRDITDAMLARSEERRAKGLLQATLDSLSAHIAILDAEATIVAVNRAWRTFADQNLYRVSHHGLGQNYLAVCRAAGANECVDARRMAQGLSDLLDGGSSEFRMEYLCGDRWFVVRAARFEHEGATHVVVAHEDITDLNETKRDLAESAERLLNLQDEERRRIAAELHDSTSQHLTAASLGLATICRTGRNDASLIAAVGGVAESLEEAQREIRTFSYLLHPPQLDRDGLATTLRDFVQGFARRAGLVARTRIDTAVDGAETGIRKATLRIVQEALANVRRHAQASRVTVEVRVKDGVLRMRIADNGKGIPISHSDPRPRLGVGIPGMQARVRQFGGELGIASGSRGTTIRAVIPLSRSQGFRQ